MLLPAVRAVEHDGAVHLFDGRRVISVRGDAGARAAVLQAAGSTAGRGSSRSPEVRDAHDLLVSLGLATDDVLDDISPAVGWALSVTGDAVSPSTVTARVADTTVHVWDGSEALLTAVRGAGLTAQDLDGVDAIATLDPRHSVVAVLDDPTAPGRRLLAADRACRQRGLAWLPVGTFDGAVVRVGPLIVPGTTACLVCLQTRSTANAAYGSLSDVLSDVLVAAGAAPAPAALTTWAASMAGLVLLRWIALADPELPGRLFTLGAAEFTVRVATVWPVPRCPACGAPDHVAAAAPWAVARDH